MSYEQMRQKYNFLPRHISSMFTDGEIKHIETTLSYCETWRRVLCSGDALLHLAQGVLNPRIAEKHQTTLEWLMSQI